MNVLLTDGNQRATLAVARSLGRAGFTVAVAEETRRSLAGVSAFTSSAILCPSPEEDPSGYQQWLVSESHGYDLLLPMTDATVQLAAAVRANLAPPARRLVPSASEVALIQDKLETLRLAEAAGIAVPRTMLAGDMDAVRRFAKEAGYPLVLKPRFSRVLAGGSFRHGAVRYAFGPEDSALGQTPAEESGGTLVQEWIGGEGRGIFLLMWNGQLKAAFAHRRLREKPPWGGVSVYCESMPLDLGLLERCVALLREVSWQGPAMVEFKVNGRDGMPTLMEINGRFWGSLQLAIDAGIDFPLLLCKLAMEESFEPQLRYRIGARNRWLLGDLDHLLNRVVRRRRPEHQLAENVPLWRAAARFANFWTPQMGYSVWRADDPRPFLLEAWNYLNRNLKRKSIDLSSPPEPASKAAPAVSTH